MPSDFTDKKDRLKLVTGAKLSYETLIFSENPEAEVVQRQSVSDCIVIR